MSEISPIALEPGELASRGDSPRDPVLGVGKLALGEAGILSESPMGLGCNLKEPSGSHELTNLDDDVCLRGPGRLAGRQGELGTLGDCGSLGEAAVMRIGPGELGILIEPPREGPGDPIEAGELESLGEHVAAWSMS